MEPKQQISTLEKIRQRALQLKRGGFDLDRAWGTAWLEHRISEWPEEWGNDLLILIFGDFKPPEDEVLFPSLGISISPEQVENSAIVSASCVLKARVRISEKNIQSLEDAMRRINLLLGSWTLVTWGNSAIRWWSWVTHDTGAAVMEPLNHSNLGGAVEGILSLPNSIRRYVDAALYWVREPRNLLKEFHRVEILRIYASYWNAFECLVEAVNILRPAEKLSGSEKQQRIDDYFTQLSSKPTAAAIEECYRTIVNPGLKSQASHALRVCFGDEADHYIEECFELIDKQERLYDIRNSINHGDIDAENPNELVRVGSRFNTLRPIVLGMFGRLIPFPAPIERSDSSSS